MKAKLLFAAATLAAAATGSAFADQTYPYVEFSNTPSTVTRAQVQDELAQAQANGTNATTSQQEYVAPDANFKSTKTRAQVMAELRQSQEDGSYQLAHEEYEGQFPAVRAAQTRLATN